MGSTATTPVGDPAAESRATDAPASVSAQPKPLGLLLRIAIDVAVVLAIAVISLMMASRTVPPGGVSSIWLAGSLLVAMFVRIPLWRWIPAAAVGGGTWFVFFLSVGWTQNGSLVRAGGEVLAVLVAAVGIRWRGCLPLRDVADVVFLTALAASVGAFRVVTVRVATLVDPAFGFPFDEFARTLILNTVLGLIVAVPFGVLLVPPPAWRRPTAMQWKWGLFLAGSSIVFGLLVLIAPSATWWLGAEFLVFPLMTAAALALPRRALAAWLMSVTLLGSWAVVAGLGPFTRVDDTEPVLLSENFRAQALMIVLSITAWVLHLLRDSWGRTTVELDQATERLNVVVDRAAVPMAFGPIVGGPIEANQAMAAFFEVPLEQMADLDWLGMTHPDDVAEDIRLTELLLRGETDSYRHLKRYVLTDGTVKWADVNVVSISRGGSGTPWGVVQVVDMTAEMTARHELELATDRFRTVVHKASIPMSFGPVLNGLAEVNDARCAFHERSREELQRMNWRELIHPEDLAAMLPLHDRLISGGMDRYRVTQRFMMPDGRIKWGDVTVARLDLGQEDDDFVVVQIVDVTPEVQARDRLQHLVDTEVVTGLGSRSWITAALQECLDRAPRDAAVAALFVDLSEYAVVTQALGYEAGDDVLSSLARAVVDTLPSDAMVGRFWGDRFLVVLSDLRSAEDVAAVAQGLLDAVSTETIVRGRRFARTGSIGIALNSRSSTVTSMLRSADHALAEAIQAGRSRWHLVHDDAWNEYGAGRLEQEHQLREALDKHQFVLLYQPQVRLVDGSVCGYEALVRWQHPDRGLLPPSEFLDVMESSGLIVDLDRQVLAMACADLAAHPDLPGRVSVNVSAGDITEPDWISHVTDTVRASGVSPDRIALEITETTLLRLTPDAQRALAVVRDMGMGLHIDDFGVGFASIGSLLQVPLTGLKLDRAFVSVLSNPTQANLDLVASIASMAKGLRLETIAEGIETTQQADMLREAGWEQGQGYLFGMPAALPD